jgi:uncharacterized protein YkwD
VPRQAHAYGAPVSAPAHARPPVPAPVALALTVTGLLLAFGFGAATLPSGVTGTGLPAEAAADLVGTGQGGSPARHAGTPPSLDAAPLAPRTTAGPQAAASHKPAPSRPAPARPAPVKPKPPKVSPGFAGQENEVIRLVNVERDKAGCHALRLDVRLRTAMRLHVQELAKHGDLYISHVSDDGRSFVDRIKAQGYDSPGGENVARGQRDAADVMNSWMHSDGHRANILNCSFKAIGVGLARGVDGTLVWGQDFGYA